MSSELETLNRHTAALQATLNGISDNTADIAHLRTELEHILRVLRQANNVAGQLRRKRRRAAVGWALLGGLLGGLVAGWLAQAFLGV